MSDRDTVSEILGQMITACQRIEWRMKGITSPDDLLESEERLEKLDGLCMMIIALGESVKNLDKVTEGNLLPRYPQVPWNNMAKMRDVISHHYFDLNAEVVYDVCANHIPSLVGVLQLMREEVGGEDVKRPSS